ncbi:MAG: hypothetical protein HY657_09475 [Acidobacteria bacterium]|nr:hypothetical protein [Acidobacteriota bacterium]
MTLSARIHQPLPRKTDASADGLLSSFLTDTILVLAIALLVYIPAAHNRLALQQRQAAASADRSATREPLRLDVIGENVLVGTPARSAASLSAAERAAYSGRTGLIRVYGSSISAAAMTELSRVYHELGLTSWAFHFESESLR